MNPKEILWLFRKGRSLAPKRRVDAKRVCIGVDLRVGATTSGFAGFCGYRQAQLHTISLAGRREGRRHSDRRFACGLAEPMAGRIMPALQS